ncbi:MAG: HAMP domain-containing sensor histidine kinase, partial [bacterium]
SLINEIIESHKSRIEELGIDITLELKEEINCLCHKNHAFSIFNNLIINALDALSDVEYRRLIIKSVPNREFVKITIFDSGSGIAKEHIDKIFDPFYSTKPHTGTGLGLAMVKKIVDIYDGKITVKSSLDNGTEFVIFLRTPTLSES